MEKENIKIVTTNRKAHFNYFLSDFLECGISLKGSEIKSLRNNHCSIDDSYCIIRNNECFILNMNIPEYDKSTVFNHDPLRSRKLLLHKNEILKFNNRMIKEGYTLIPTKVYFKNGMCKVEIALGKGKKLYDKREVVKNRDIERDLKKKMKNF